MRSSHLTIFCFFLLFLIALIVLLPIHVATAQDTSPQPLTPADGAIFRCDPHTGWAEQMVFSWTAFENSTEYQLQTAHDPLFDPIILDVPVTTTTYEPAHLQCQQTCAWRVRATKPVQSQWSPVSSFIIYAGLPIDLPWKPEVVSPCNGCLDIPVQSVSFSWSPFFFYPPFKEATRYKFMLARDSLMSQIVAETDVVGTTYKYNGTLDYNTKYYWQIMVLEQTYPEWSRPFSFQTESAPPPTPPTPRPFSGMSCTQANIGSPSALLDVSCILLVPLLLGLVFASRRRPGK